MSLFIVNILDGLVTGLLLFMLCSGLTLIFSMMGVLNFAGCDSHMASFLCGEFHSANHAASASCATTVWLSFAHFGGFHRSSRFRRGAMAIPCFIEASGFEQGAEGQNPLAAFAPPALPRTLHPACHQDLVRRLHRARSDCESPRWQLPHSSCGCGYCGSSPIPLGFRRPFPLSATGSARRQSPCWHHLGSWRSTCRHFSNQAFAAAVPLPNAASAAALKC